MRCVLVTGGAGFIGSCFVRRLLDEPGDRTVVNLDALTYAGNLANLASVAQDPRYRFVKGDITDRALVASLFEQYSFDKVVNFAAESHVDRSIREPEIFLRTNVLGTQCLLDCARDAWMIGRDSDGYPRYREGVRFVQISTDEVYGALGATGLFTEDTPLSPNSPYSVSKASADMLARAYYTTFRLPVCVTRCSNNYGPFQFPEKLIPLMIGNALEDKPLPVYGDGMQVRDWIHVDDHCSAVQAVIERGRPGEVYNIGGSSEKANLEIVRTILDALGKPETLIRHVKDRLGHDRRYAIDNAKITGELGWTPRYTFDQGMSETIAWYLVNKDWLDGVRSGAYLSYYSEYYGDRT
ncbi:MAG: dTDP-glucose 4,6-dehydratase [Clostridiales bacterium]|nr:dTDP-glucose 4,6-dehydratase [Clostridiales bacterium]